MPYKISEMLYDDGTYYKWGAPADHDNPYYTKGADHPELDRTEGYEVRYFISHLADQLVHNPRLTTYQKIEKMIRYDVPESIRTHKKIADWIFAHWEKVSV